MKTRKFSFLLLSLFTILFFACNSSESGDAESAAEAAAEEVVEEVTEEAVEEAKEEAEAPSIVAVAAHAVKDFDAWLPVFEAHKADRESATLTDLGVYQSKDDPNFIYVSVQVGDVDAAKAFTESDELKKIMEEAGVTGEPDITFYENMMLDKEAGQSSPYRGVVRHEVKDWDEWIAYFNKYGEENPNDEVSMVSVSRELDNPNNVSVVATAADYATLENFINSEEIQTAMLESGMVGEPTIIYGSLTKGYAQ